MASGTKAKKHKCSCGRSFRHAISLKRHQNVTGCGAAAEEAAPEAVEAAAEETPAASSATKKRAARPAAAAPAAQEDSRSIVITPELVAAWQEQTGFNKRPSVVDSIAPPPARKEVDWAAVGQTAKEFAGFCGEVQQQAVSGAKNILSVLARAALFCSVLTLSGWFLVTTVSASVTVDADEAGRRQIAARTLVEDFLQNAKLNHYQRARRLLAPGARKSVSASQLQVMINSLPLHDQPTEWETELSNDGNNAKVVVHRHGLQEVYTLVHGDSGWGLASVAVANS